MVKKSLINKCKKLEDENKKLKEENKKLKSQDYIEDIIKEYLFDNFLYKRLEQYIKVEYDYLIDEYDIKINKEDFIYYCIDDYEEMKNYFSSDDIYDIVDDVCDNDKIYEYYYDEMDGLISNKSGKYIDEKIKEYKKEHNINNENEDEENDEEDEL